MNENEFVTPCLDQQRASQNFTYAQNSLYSIWHVINFFRQPICGIWSKEGARMSLFPLCNPAHCQSWLLMCHTLNSHQLLGWTGFPFFWGIMLAIAQYTHTPTVCEGCAGWDSSIYSIFLLIDIMTSNTSRPLLFCACAWTYKAALIQTADTCMIFGNKD